MFRRRVLPILVIAAAMGLITSVMVYRTVKAKGMQGGATEEIAVAAANVDLGEALTSKHIKMVAWPKVALPADAIRSAKDAEGRIARSSIVAGEPILESRLAASGQGGLMPVLVPKGKRAVTVKVDEAVQRSGFILPNSHVDILVTLADKAGEKKTRIVLQNVTVLASDQTVEMKDNKPVRMTTVTMAITPEESERLALAQNEGKVTMALRNLQDTASVVTSGVTIAQLMSSPGTPSPSRSEKKSTLPQQARRAAHPTQTSARPPVETAASRPGPSSQPTYTISVIRGITLSESVFVKDPDRGWLERPTKAGPPTKAEGNTGYH